MTLPLVTIGITCFNHERYIKECIDSVLNQDYQHIELLVSDDNSSDASFQSIQSSFKADSRVSIFRQSYNIGLANNFMFVLEQAAGEYFMWLAGDDYLAPHAVSALLNTITSYSFGSCGVQGSIVFKDERIIRNPMTRPKILNSFESHAIVHYYLEDDTRCKALYLYGLFATKTLRSSRTELLGLPFIGDILYVASLLSSVALYSTSEPTLVYRRHASNTGVKQLKPYMGFKRYLFAAHPPQYFSLYRQYIFDSLHPANFLVLVFFKALLAQYQLWLRGIRQSWLYLSRDARV